MRILQSCNWRNLFKLIYAWHFLWSFTSFFWYKKRWKHFESYLSCDRYMYFEEHFVTIFIFLIRSQVCLTSFMADSFSVVSWRLTIAVIAVTLQAEVFLLHGVYKRFQSQSFTSLVSCIVYLFYMPQEKVSPGVYKTNQLCDRQVIQMTS